MHNGPSAFKRLQDILSLHPNGIITTTPNTNSLGLSAFLSNHGEETVWVATMMMIIIMAR